MTLEAVLQQALQLPQDQRAELVERLLSSLDGDDSIDEGYEEAWAAEIERRVREVEEGTAELVDSKEALRRIRARLVSRPR